MSERIVDIVIGAGASGLMASRELAQAGHQVIGLEARERVGGRIWPLDVEELGYPAQGGGEFIHGRARVTRRVMNEAGLAYIPEAGGTDWSYVHGVLQPADEADDFGVIQQQLHALQQDMPIAEFFDRYFSDSRFVTLRERVLQRVGSYEAADPYQMSTFALRKDWLGGAHPVTSGRLQGGYGALLDHMRSGNEKLGVQLQLEHEVAAIEIGKSAVSVTCTNGKTVEGNHVISTIPLPVLGAIEFKPAVPEVMAAAQRIGNGGVIKTLLRFRDQWWRHETGQDMSNLNFIFTDGPFQAWWTQHPDQAPILTGYMAGPNAKENAHVPASSVEALAIATLSSMFQVPAAHLQNQLVKSAIFNWLSDKYAGGAYSFPTVHSEEARAFLRRPVGGRLFFAGEALCSSSTSTVEAALASGVEVARQILL